MKSTFFCRDGLNLKATLPIEQKIFVWMLERGIVSEKRKTLDIIINILFIHTDILICTYYCLIFISITYLEVFQSQMTTQSILQPHLFHTLLVYEDKASKKQRLLSSLSEP